MAGPRFGNITIDCTDVEPLVPFWTEAFGYEIDQRGDGRALLRDPAGRSPRIYLQPVPEKKGVKNRVHIDFYVADLQAEAKRLEALGATELWRPTDGPPTVVMADPGGNEFCISQMPPDKIDNPFG